MPRLVRKQDTAGSFTPFYEVRGLVKSLKKEGVESFVVVRELNTLTYFKIPCETKERFKKEELKKIVSQKLKCKQKNVLIPKHLNWVD